MKIMFSKELKLAMLKVRANKLSKNIENSNILRKVNRKIKKMEA